ncbi:MAG: rhamnan synthesis F family protein [Boseongicola sp.]|nr:rhamnan synthesis F family protein [Boseongicola sp.]NNJ67942.1 hypothetical protein [Boseongicola sp.]
MIPKWKLLRELDRLKTHAQAIPLAVSEPFLQRRYDARRDQDLKVYEGSLAASDTLAIFLVYQPRGVAASVFRTCAHLVESGFAPLVISNTPLSEADRSSFQELSHCVVERPNFGYDFGGYRDGVWLMGKLGLSPKQVLFLNDSVWFPIYSHSTLLSEWRDAPEDYLGTQVFGDIAASGNNRGFFGSYCFMIKTPLLDTNAFQSFWSDYRVSSNKEVTLRRGERAFSRQMLDAASASKAFFSLERFDALVNALSIAKLREAIGDLVATDPTLIAHQKAMIAAGLNHAARQEMVDLLKASARSKNYIGAAPVLSLREMAFPMIKKNNERHYMLARKRIVKALDEGRMIPLNPDIEEELRARDHG